MLIPLGTNDWASETENYQRFRLHNMYLTPNPLAPDGMSRVSRPTLTQLTTIGTGPICGMWRQESSLDGKWLVVSGVQLFSYNASVNVATSIGIIPGSGFCQFAGTLDRALIVRDGICYSTDGVTISTIVMPDDVDPYTPLPASVGSVRTINGYFLLSILDLDRFYWIAPGETDPDPLSYSTAERIPDSIKSMHIISDEIWFVGVSGPEVWSTTGDADAPFQRINGRVYSDGCAFRDTSLDIVYQGLPAAIWVTDTRSVVIAQGQITKVSNESVEETLKTGTNLRGWFLRHNRHDFYILTAEEFTLSLDLMNGSWAAWDTYGKTNWQAHLGLQAGYLCYAGDSVTNVIWSLEEGESDGDLPVIREVSGVVPNQEKSLSCTNVYAKVNVGWSPSYGFEPVLELRWSDDQGCTWSNYRQASLGDKGEYNTQVIFRSLGRVIRPGRVFEFRFSEFARFRLDYATMNEQM